MEQLVVLLIGALAEYGPTLIKDLVDLVHGTPKADGETSEAYVARLNGLISAKLQDAKAKDAQVLNES